MYFDWTGLLRLHAKDIARIQSLLDPLVLTLLFVGLEPGCLWVCRGSWFPFWALVYIAAHLILPRAGLYSSHRHRSLKILTRRITTTWVLILSLLLSIVFLSNSSSNLSRIDISLWAIIGWFWLVVNHVILRKWLRWHRSQGGNSRSIVYWGLPDAAAAFAHQLESNRWMGFQIVAWFSPLGQRPDHDHPNLPGCSGGLRELRDWLNSNDVDRLVFSHATLNGLGIDQLIQLFGDFSIPIVYAPHWAHPTMRFTVDTLGMQPCIDLWGSEQSLLDRQLKRSFDLALTSVGVVLLAPLLVAIVLVVKLSSPGPIFYKQDRYGLDGKCFKCFKFRTMYVIDSADQAVLNQATVDDTRVTKVGKFLRGWSLDELPQLFNVLRGEMSLVGPRPHAVQHNELYRKVIPGYMQRHAYKPGITGLAQVSGWRGETRELLDMENRIYADLTYQREWCLKLDIKILIKTFFRLRSGNAY